MLLPHATLDTSLLDPWSKEQGIDYQEFTTSSGSKASQIRVRCSSLPHCGTRLALPSPSSWLIWTIRLGYVTHFARRPQRFSGILFTLVAKKWCLCLCPEIMVLLAKDAIKPGPPVEMNLGLCSLYFIEPYKLLVTFLGYLYFESGPAQAPIQDVVAEAQPDMMLPPRLFCSDLS